MSAAILFLPARLAKPGMSDDFDHYVETQTGERLTSAASGRNALMRRMPSSRPRMSQERSPEGNIGERFVNVEFKCVRLAVDNDAMKALSAVLVSMQRARRKKSLITAALSDMFHNGRLTTPFPGR